DDGVALDDPNCFLFDLIGDVRYRLLVEDPRGPGGYLLAGVVPGGDVAHGRVVRRKDAGDVAHGGAADDGAGGVARESAAQVCRRYRGLGRKPGAVELDAPGPRLRARRHDGRERLVDEMRGDAVVAGEARLHTAGADLFVEARPALRLAVV